MIRLPVGMLNWKLVQVIVDGLFFAPFFPVIFCVLFAYVLFMFFRLFSPSKVWYFPPVVWVMVCGYFVIVGIFHLLFFLFWFLFLTWFFSPNVCFYSEGTGDLSIRASVRSLVSETYSITDASYYNPNSINADTSLSVSTIPTNFKATYTIKRASSQSGWIEIGADSNNLLFFGVDSGNGAIGIYVKKNGSYETYQRNSSNIAPANTDTLVEYSYNNGVQTLKVNGTTVTLTNSTITSRNYVAYSAHNGTIIKELIIKPL